MIELFVRRHFDHQANAATVEEGQAGRDLKEETHPEPVAIERDGTIQILHRRGDLPDRRQLRHGSLYDTRVFIGLNEKITPGVVSCASS